MRSCAMRAFSFVVVTVLGAIGVALGGLVAGGIEHGGSTIAVAAGTTGLSLLEQCSTKTAPASDLPLARPIGVVSGLDSSPYAVVVDAGWAFVTEPTGYRHDTGLISVLRLEGANARLARTVSVPGTPMGAALAVRGRFLVVANYRGGLEVLSTARSKAARAQPCSPR